MTTLHVVTANTPGAIALIQIQGPEASRVLGDLTGHHAWTPGQVRLANFANIDQGLAVAIHHPRPTAPGSTTIQLMPHGGPRVVQLLVDHLVSLGCIPIQNPDPQATYPEAATPIEADQLHGIALAMSPAAIDLLASQPARWARLLAQPGQQRDAQRQAIHQRAAILNQLITPPTVVVAGPPNVGKSTLTNALMGRAVSIVADLPGTTRDWVGGVVELRSGLGCGVSGFAGNKKDTPNGTQNAAPKPGTQDPVPEIAVRWLDTPGLRASSDAIEQRAITLARSVVAGAEVLIAMRDAGSDWPEAATLPRAPDLWVVNKYDDAETQHAGPHEDLPGRLPDHPLRISAEHGHGLPALQHAVLAKLGLDTLGDATPWAFSPTLQAWAAGESVDLDAYVAPHPHPI